MGKNQNKIEKLLNDLKLEQVSGGFVGRDWNKKDASIYDELGIKHNRNALKKDTYYVSNTKVPKKFVYALVDKYKNGEKEGVKNLAQELQDLILDLENGKDIGATPEEVYNDLDEMFN